MGGHVRGSNRQSIDDPNQPARTRLWLFPITLAVAQVFVHLTAGLGYGIFRDEFYYWDCANHLSWGYVDQPPFSSAVLAAWKSIFGDSLLSMRVPPALAGGALILLVARLAGRLGGGMFGRSLAALIAFAVPSYLGITGIYSMNAYELLFWAAGYLVVLDLLEEGRRRDWALLGLLVGFGMLNKISIAVFAMAAGIVILAKQRLRILRRPDSYLALLIAIGIFAPHLVWQVQNGWPTREFVHNAQQLKMTAMNPLQFLGGVAMEMGPPMVPLLVLGLVALFTSRVLRTGRPLAWIFLVALAVFTFNRSKPYYTVAAFPPVLASAAVWIERFTARRLQWIRGVTVVYVLAGFAIAAPFAIPLLPVERFIAYQARLGMRIPSGERLDTGVLPQFFADRFGWKELTQQVASIVQNLPAGERDSCLLVARNYGQAGALNYYGRTHGLPRAVCQHNSYYLWGPGPGTPKVYLIVGQRREDLEAVFTEVEEVGRTGARFAMPYETGIPIWICRGLRIPLDEAWRRGRMYIWPSPPTVWGRDEFSRGCSRLAQDLHSLRAISRGIRRLLGVVVLTDRARTAAPAPLQEVGTCPMERSWRSHSSDSSS
jgi:Dolichyl-phosphate-mannose-protein mannosyltransferase